MTMYLRLRRLFFFSEGMNIAIVVDIDILGRTTSHMVGGISNIRLGALLKIIIFVDCLRSRSRLLNSTTSIHLLHLLCITS